MTHQPVEIHPYKQIITRINPVLKIPEERLDVLKITWTDQEMITRSLPKIDDKHLGNLIPWLRRKKYPVAMEIMKGELGRRLYGNLPINFAELVNAYEQAPETWRLKIHRP
jgi:hypothetical protein